MDVFGYHHGKPMCIAHVLQSDWQVLPIGPMTGESIQKMAPFRNGMRGAMRAALLFFCAVSTVVGSFEVELGGLKVRCSCCCTALFFCKVAQAQQFQAAVVRERIPTKRAVIGTN